MNNKYLIILLILIFLLIKKKEKKKKQWLFLLNGQNVLVNKNKLELNLTHNIIGFTDRPYHDIKNLSREEMKDLFEKINTTKNKPNTTLIAYTNNKKKYNSNCIIEINKINFSEKKHKDIDIEFKILEGELYKNYYDNISLTIDSWADWFKHAANTVSSTVVKAEKATVNVVKEATNPETYKKAFNEACKKVAYPILEKVTTRAGISAGCNLFCPETTIAIDAAGGGPEDPVGDALAVVELAGCYSTCTSVLNKGYTTYKLIAKDDPNLNMSKYLGNKLCNTMIKI
jgi:Fe-S cluster biosynthesis and repair protein YggX